MSDEEKLVSHYRLKTILRKDGFGAVYFSEDTRDQKECILRVIELDQTTLRRITGRMRAHSQRDHPLIEQIRQRMKRVAELRNSHILPVIEFGEEHIQGNNDIIFYMVSPYEKESLLSYWSQHTSRSELISLEIILAILEQAAGALHYVHRRGLIHQYVRLSSFMLRSTTRSRKFHLYLTDFWFADITAHLLEEGQIAQDLSVYLASEQLSGSAVAASDQYALAVLIYELLLGYRLSGVDLSIDLYERALRQRGISDELELDRAQRLDLVLRRALAEDASSRYQNIDIFASTFRAVARGEAASGLLEEDTASLPVLGRGRDSKAAEVAATAVGALAAGEIIAQTTESQVESEEGVRTRHPSLHKTILTSEGMEVTEEGVGSSVVEAASTDEQEMVVSERDAQAGKGTLAVVEEERTGTSTGIVAGVVGPTAGEILERGTLAEEETLTPAGEEATGFSAGGGVGMAGFVGGLAAGEVRQAEALAEEETLTVIAQEQAGTMVGSAADGGAAGFVAGQAAGEVRQGEVDLTSEQTLVAERRAPGEVHQGEIDRAGTLELLAEGAAAGLVTGEVLQGETDLLQERTLRTELIEERSLSAESNAATFVAGETRQREIDIAEEKRKIREDSIAAFAAGLAAGEARQSEVNREEEQRLRERGATAFAEGAVASLAAGETRQREIDVEEERTERRESGTATFAAGAAAGLVAGEALEFEQGKDIAAEQTRIIPAGGTAGGTAIYAQETDISVESTQIIPASGGIVAEGAASGGAIYAQETDISEESTQIIPASGAAGLIAGGMLAGGLEATQVAEGSGASVGGGVSEGEAEAGDSAAALAGAGLAASGYVGGATRGTGGVTQVAGGMAGGIAGSGGVGVVPLPASAKRKRRRRGRTLLAVILIALLLFLVLGSIFVFALNNSSATVTVTRVSHTISNTYLVTATMSSTTTSGQIQAMRFTQRVSLSKSGKSTGYYEGSHSSGFIRFYNASTGCGCPMFIPAGTVFTGASGVTVVTDEGASVAALCYVTVHAHAVVSGPGGNIPAMDVRATYRSKITASNPFAFSGGQVGQSNALVQQSDINRLAGTLKGQVIQSAQTSIQAQLQSNQHLFAQPDCRTRVKSNHAAGDYASSFTVTVSATCTAEAYDYSAAIKIVEQQVQVEASSYSNNEYELVGGLQTEVSSATLTDAKAGTILLAVKALGKWMHRLGSNLTNLIANQNVSQAREILKLVGAASVDISISGFNQNTLPDGSKIKIVLKG